ncbi:ABC transporter substrate-binding protein [Sulfurimonas diazotrophicus]|uniref:ABC transporter substrate-binding protein n=1 Tax=Sulfurimonas diazotrophicus TaxID=3131939 RepID=A0ABZ3HAA4_9BACT
MNRLLLTLFISVLVSVPQALSDMKEDQATVQKVFGSSPPMNYLLYALAPDKMIGLNFAAKNPFNGADPAYLDARFLALPVIGSFHGSGSRINLESLIAARPDLVLIWEDDMLVQTVTDQITKLGVPTMTVPFRQIDSMPDAMERVGDAIGAGERGRKLADYTRTVIAEINTSLAGTKPTRYYYAEGLDGLSTECDTSFHVVAMNFAGGENVHKCRQSNLRGLEKINFETLLAYDPEVIIVQHAMVYGDLVEDPMWQQLRAVKAGRIYLVPTLPFNWVDRPPSFMRVIGIQWLASLFHPEAYDVDLKARVAAFYKLFLGVDLSAQEIDDLLAP